MIHLKRPNGGRNRRGYAWKASEGKYVKEMFRLTNLVILDRKSWWEYSLEWLADQCERLSSNLNSSVNKIIIDVEIGLNNVLIIWQAISIVY